MTLLPGKGLLEIASTPIASGELLQAALSVQRDQNRVRVSAQLIDGESGAHLWADQFE